MRIVVCSATVDAEQLRDFFNINTTKDSTKDTAVILTIEGRLYPVDIFFIKGIYLYAFFIFILYNYIILYHPTKK